VDRRCLFGKSQGGQADCSPARSRKIVRTGYFVVGVVAARTGLKPVGSFDGTTSAGTNSNRSLPIRGDGPQAWSLNMETCTSRPYSHHRPSPHTSTINPDLPVTQVAATYGLACQRSVFLPGWKKKPSVRPSLKENGAGPFGDVSAPSWWCKGGDRRLRSFPLPTNTSDGQ